MSRDQRGRKEPCKACVEEGSCKCGHKTHTGKTEQETLGEWFKGSGGRGMERFAQPSTSFTLQKSLTIHRIVSCGFCWISVQPACEHAHVNLFGT